MPACTPAGETKARKETPVTTIETIKDILNENLDIDLYRFRGGEFEEERKVASALAQDSLLGREKALDDITWEKISSLETFHYFDITAVLAYVAKLHIVNRWLALDEQKGRELFRRLVQEVKGTFKGVNYTEQ